MKQDRKWLKNQIEIMGTETSENYPHEQMVDREVVLKLVDQLDEPEVTEEQALNKLVETLPMSAEQLGSHFNSLVAHGGRVMYGGKPEITQEQAWEVLAPRFSMTAKELERQVLDGFLEMTMEEIEMESNKIKKLADGIKKLHAENEELKAKLNGQDSPTSQEEAIWFEEAAERLGISIVEKPIIPQLVADWIEHCKANDLDLYEAFGHSDMSVEVSDLVGDMDADILARAWLDGYEIEKEKLYYVIIPTKDTSGEYYYLDGFGGIDSAYDLKEVEHHTESFIRFISESLWQFAKEVTE